MTDRGVLGKTVDELNLDDRFSVAVTRVTRADLEMTAVPGLRLQFGDQLQLVGRDNDLDKAAAAVGDSIKELNQTQFIPFFIGIVLGVALGTLPIAVPGSAATNPPGSGRWPAHRRLILGRIGRIRRQVWHMPTNTNLAFREFGIALFFAAVGLRARREIFRDGLQPHRSKLAGRRTLRHGAADPPHRSLRARRLENKFHGSKRLDCR